MDEIEELEKENQKLREEIEALEEENEELRKALDNAIFSIKQGIEELGEKL